MYCFGDYFVCYYFCLFVFIYLFIYFSTAGDGKYRIGLHGENHPRPTLAMRHPKNIPRYIIAISVIVILNLPMENLEKKMVDVWFGLVFVAKARRYTPVFFFVLAILDCLDVFDIKMLQNRSFCRLYADSINPGIIQ
jgi:hypothetical protein